jgi:RNA 2',3'-cyclic 3'-phosphodiesterase
VTRAFVAIRPTDAVLDDVDARSTSLDLGDARRTTRDQWHVTLQFLGNRADVDAVADALTDLQVPAATARLGGLGAFPSEKRARVVWLGVAQGAELFGALAREVGERLTPLGHVPEARAYHAHLTLARLKTPADVRVALASDVTTVGDAWLVDEVILYESRVRRTGAEYIPVASAPLSLPG